MTLFDLINFDAAELANTGPIYQMHQVAKRRQLEVRKYCIRKLGPPGSSLCKPQRSGM